jgi:hypothetical protein
MKDRGVPMKIKFNNIISHISKIDYSYIQFAYLLVMVAGFLFAQTPSDGGTGPH